jgi:hypothetical protein
MKAAVGKWWSKREEFSCVEKDDGLHISTPRRWPWVSDLIYLIIIITMFMKIESLNLPPQYLLPLVLAVLLWIVGRLDHHFFPLGAPFARVDSQLLVLCSPGSIWPKINLALPMLRSLTIQMLRADQYGVSPCLIRYELNDGYVNTKRMVYRADVMAAVIGYLRRKLPPSVKFTLDDSALYADGGGA